MTVYLTKEIIRRSESARVASGIEARNGEKSLGEGVLEAVRQIRDTDLTPVAGREAPRAYHPRELLALITYCYAIGVYGSEDIERMMRTDARFRKLCGNEFPGAPVLRRFRRHNRDVIRECLEHALRFAGARAPDSSAALDQPTFRAGTEVPTADAFTQEAGARIEQAMFIDRMESEI